MLLFSPLLVWVAFQPSGTLPTSPLAKRNARDLPSPACSGAASNPATRTHATMRVQRIAQSPCGVESETWPIMALRDGFRQRKTARSALETCAAGTEICCRFGADHGTLCG